MGKCSLKNRRGPQDNKVVTIDSPGAVAFAAVANLARGAPALAVAQKHSIILCSVSFYAQSHTTLYNLFCAHELMSLRNTNIMINSYFTPPVALAACAALGAFAASVTASVAPFAV